MGFWGYFFLYGFIFTYLTWGFVVAFESVLLMSKSKMAVEWVKKRYTLKFFMFEIYIFFPMVFLGYLFLEYIPYLLGKNDKLAKFDIAGAVYEVFKDEIDEADLK